MTCNERYSTKYSKIQHRLHTYITINMHTSSALSRFVIYYCTSRQMADFVLLFSSFQTWPIFRVVRVFLLLVFCLFPYCFWPLNKVACIVAVFACTFTVCTLYELLSTGREYSTYYQLVVLLESSTSRVPNWQFKKSNNTQSVTDELQTKLVLAVAR